MSFKIAVCIPCHEPHIVFLHDCIQSIEQQTRKPDMICISISSVSSDKIPTFDTSIPIFMETTATQQCAGKNRNVASQMATDRGADILTYIDADDRMSPYRIACLETAFQTSPFVGLVLHNTQRINRNNPIDIEWKVPTGYVNTGPFKIHRDSVCGRVHYMGNPNSLYQLGHCGHITLRSNVWDQTKHVEGYGMGEDSEYVWRCVTNGVRPGFIEDVLTAYYFV